MLFWQAYRQTYGVCSMAQFSVLVTENIVLACNLELCYILIRKGTQPIRK